MHLSFLDSLFNYYYSASGDEGRYTELFITYIFIMLYYLLSKQLNNLLVVHFIILFIQSTTG